MESLIVDHIFSLFKIIVFTVLLLFAFNGIVNKKPFTSILIGISTFAFLVSTFISFNLLYGKYTIYIFYGIAFLAFTYKILKEPLSFFKFIKKQKGFVFLLTITGLVSLFYLLINLTVNFSYNGHDPYFYGIPFEILEGNYSSRIKIWDNYPVKWSKYHFFPGAFASILLFFAGLKNIFLYKFYKLLLIGIMFFALDENINKKYKSQFYKTLIFSLPVTIWLFNTNGALPLLFLFIATALYLNNKTEYSVLFLLFFASSLSRHVFPGVFLFLFVIANNYKVLAKSKTLILWAFPIINIVSMIFTGYNPIAIDLSYYIEGGFVDNFLYGIGGSFLFQNVLYSIYDVTVVNQISLHSIVYLSPLLFLLLVIKNQKVFLIKLLPVIIISTSVLLQLLIKLEPTSSILLIKNGFFINLVYFINASISFYFPYYVFKIFYSKKRGYNILFLFYVLSILNLIIVPSSGPPVHYYFIDIIVVFFLCKDIKLNIISHKKEWVIIAFIIFSILPLNSSQHYFDPPTQYLSKREIDKTPLKYSSYEDKEELIIESNIYGLRINYSQNSEEQYHLSKQFLSPE